MCDLGFIGKLSISPVLRAFIFLGLVLTVVSSRGQNVPINAQGRVTVDGVAFTGIGKFKFALVHSTGRSKLWTHDGTGTSPNYEPTTSIDLTVTRGLFSVMLGDPTESAAFDPEAWQQRPPSMTSQRRGGVRAMTTTPRRADPRPARLGEIGLAGIVPGSEPRVKHTVGCRMISRGIVPFELSHLFLQ